MAERSRRRGNHLITVATEHKAVLDPLERLGRRGFEVTLLGVEQAASPRAGSLDPDALAAVIRDDTLLVSVMLANNEIGIMQPLAEIGRICRQRGVLLHCDATQAVGKLPVDVEQLGVDLAELSAPQDLRPQGHRRPVRAPRPAPRAARSRRSPAAATSTACAAARSTCRASSALPEPSSCAWRKCRTNRRGWPDCEIGCSQGLAAASGRRHAQRAGSGRIPGRGARGWRPRLRLAGNLNVSFAYVDGEALMMDIKDLAVSSGSACTSANPEPSHVLRALGLSDDATRSSLRFGLGRFNTAEEVDFAVSSVAAAVGRLRKLSSMA